MTGALSIAGVLGVAFLVAVAWSCCVISGDCSREEEDLFSFLD
jgi:hypothetical protein